MKGKLFVTKKRDFGLLSMKPNEILILKPKTMAEEHIAKKDVLTGTIRLENIVFEEVPTINSALKSIVNFQNLQNIADNTEGSERQLYIAASIEELIPTLLVRLGNTQTFDYNEMQFSGEVTLFDGVEFINTTWTEKVKEILTQPAATSKEEKEIGIVDAITSQLISKIESYYKEYLKIKTIQPISDDVLFDFFEENMGDLQEKFKIDDSYALRILYALASKEQIDKMINEEKARRNRNIADLETTNVTEAEEISLEIKEEIEKSNIAVEEALKARSEKEDNRKENNAADSNEKRYSNKIMQLRDMPTGTVIGLKTTEGTLVIYGFYGLPLAFTTQRAANIVFAALKEHPKFKNYMVDQVDMIPITALSEKSKKEYAVPIRDGIAFLKELGSENPTWLPKDWDKGIDYLSFEEEKKKGKKKLKKNNNDK